ncbi:MAG: hypothetical protein GXP04_06180 [Alphaproteobacteria bacterium]|nr:hypothetical protein [Alphaproteobacteria bacterium]
MLDAILNALPRKLTSLEVKLHGVSGYTGRGEIAFTAWKSGAKEMEIELRGVAGRCAEVFIDDVFSINVDLDNGRIDHTFTTRKGDNIPDLTEGARVDVRQNGEIILEGVLVPN